MKMNPIRCEQGASLLEKGEACGISRERGTALSMSKPGPSSLLVWLGQAGGEGLMWKMRELPDNRTPPQAVAGSSQSAHSSDEAGNDRGAKGRRKEKP